MDLKDIDDDFTGSEINLPCDKPNQIRLNDVFEFMVEANQDEILRIIDFAQPLSGLCSVKEASEVRNIKPSSYSSLDKYKKYKFIGKTFGFKNNKKG